MTYIVKPGDNLWSIATRFGTTPQAIMRRNGITDPNMIFVGQTLIIPVPTPGPGPRPIPQPTPYPQDLVRRVERLERRVERLNRRVTRLEQGRLRSTEEEY